MEGIYSKYWVLLSIIFMVFNGTVYAQSSWIVDDRHISQSWPYATLVWLKQHAPPACVQWQLDALLSQPAIATILSNIYTYYYLSPQEKDMLLQAGFTFLGGKLNIFQIKTIPGYVLKIAAPKNGHSELLNLGRIAQADILRANAKTWGIGSFLKIPKKYAYIVPPFSEVIYRNQPKVIVVAEKVPNFRKKRKVMRSTIAKAWLMIKGTPDLKKRNMQFSKSGLTLLDTEPWRCSLVPGFTHTTTVIPRPSTHPNELDARAYMPEFYALPPTQKHGFSGKWNCVTPQGIIVQSPYLRCAACWCNKERR